MKDANTIKRIDARYSGNIVLNAGGEEKLATAQTGIVVEHYLRAVFSRARVFHHHAALFYTIRFELLASDLAQFGGVRPSREWPRTSAALNLAGPPPRMITSYMKRV
jgi:hypothetical protein